MHCVVSRSVAGFPIVQLYVRWAREVGAVVQQIPQLKMGVILATDYDDGPNQTAFLLEKMGDKRPLNPFVGIKGVESCEALFIFFRGPELKFYASDNKCEFDQDLSNFSSLKAASEAFLAPLDNYERTATPHGLPVGTG